MPYVDLWTMKGVTCSRGTRDTDLLNHIYPKTLGQCPGRGRSTRLLQVQGGGLNTATLALVWSCPPPPAPRALLYVFTTSLQTPFSKFRWVRTLSATLHNWAVYFFSSHPRNSTVLLRLRALWGGGRLQTAFLQSTGRWPCCWSVDHTLRSSEEMLKSI